VGSVSEIDAKLQWETVLDIDKLNEEEGKSWVWKGSRMLSVDLDESNKEGEVERCLLFLSDGGADATHVREFDLVNKRFLPASEKPFVLPEAKSSVAYMSRDVLVVGTQVDDESMTDSGYPRNARRWVRGTDYKIAPVTYAGEKEDVSVNAWVDDQRHRGGPVYEFQSRSKTFYTSSYNARVVPPSYLLADSGGLEKEPVPAFTELGLQEDAEVSMFGELMIISLRSEWAVNGETYPTGSLLATPFASFVRDPETSK
jgi:prolyl oligopeptidase